MRFSQTKMVVNGSMAADIVSGIIPIDQVVGYAVQADYTTSGSLGGTLSLEASSDHVQDINGNVTTPGNFVTITNSPVVLTGAGSYIWNIWTANYLYFRLRYTHAGGDSGTLNAVCTTKGF
jgi:hypothetical protein